MPAEAGVPLLPEETAMEDLQVLKKMRLFKDLSTEEIIQVRNFLKTRKFKKGATVVDEGHRGQCIFIIKKGELKVTHFVRGRRRELGTVRTGNHFGEVAFIDRKPRSASIRAITDSELLLITRRNFEKLLHKNPSLRIKLMQALLEDLCEKLRDRKFALDFEFSDLLPVMVLETDVHGKATFANRTALESFGFTEEDFTRGLNLFEMISPEDRGRAKKDLLKPKGSERSAVHEYMAVTKDGTTFPMLLQGQPLTLGGKRAGLRATILNISERKKTEKALRESEKRYRTIAETATDAILTIDEESRILFTNASVSKIFGYSKKELLGQSLTMLMPEPYRNLHRSSLKRYVRTRKKHIAWHGFELTGLHKNGKEIPLEISFAESVLNGRNIFTGIVRDITERKKAEQELLKGKEALSKAHNQLEVKVRQRTEELVRANKALAHDVIERKKTERQLRQSEEKYRTIIGNIEDGYYEADLAGNLTFFNDSLCKLFGYPAEDLVGLNNREYMNAENARKVYEMFHQVYMTGEPLRSLDCQVRRKDQQIRNVEISCSLIRDAHEQPAGFRGIIRDITDKIRNEEERQQLAASRRQAQMMETMGHLVTGVAHEVRNPLNAIQATADALQEDLGTSPEYAPFLDVIRSQVSRLSVLMSDLLELGRPADTSRMQEESLAELCNVAIRLWKETAANNTHAVELLQPLREEPKIYADGARIQQVILNLLDNSAQHSPAGSQIQVAVFEKNGTAHLRVSDEGPGVSPENLSRLFEPFFTTRPSGIGLGLSLVKHIVETHGGDVALYNNDPRPGVTVEITFRNSTKNKDATSV